MHHEPAKEIQTLQSSNPAPGDAPHDNSTAGGSMMNTLAPNADNTINTDHDNTINASQGVPAAANTIDVNRGVDQQQVIPEEPPEAYNATGSNFGNTTQTQMVEPSNHPPSQN